MCIRDRARTDLTQKLSDLANGLGVAGIELSTFQFNGHLFTESLAGWKITPAPPNLEDVGGAP